MRMAEVLLFWGEFHGICPRFNGIVDVQLDSGNIPWKMSEV
jgi:hypothetical protein